VRVAIEEDSEDDEPTIEEIGATSGSGIESKFPLTKKKDIEAHQREATILMKNGGKAFMDKWEKFNKSKETVKIQEVVPEVKEKINQKKTIDDEQA